MSRSGQATYLSGGGLETMIPTHPQPSTSKRKTPEDTNPLQPTTKRARKDGAAQSGTATKRKLMGEAKPGGLVIFRAPQTRSSSGQTPHSHHPDSQPQSSQPNPEQATLRSKSPKPTALKAKADRAPPPRRTGKGKDRELPASTRSEPELDEDVLQMRTETDALRRQSRSENSIGSVNGSFQFPPARPPRSPHERIHDASQPIPLQETPQIQKNKIMRGETGHRRRSSVSRGKRASSSFENTGVITQPHTSVADSAFYKHIDVDLPEPQRAQQLLIWCSYRSMHELSENPSESSSARVSRHAGKDPPLSKDDLQLLKGLQDSVIHLLAEKKIDTNVFSPPGEVASRPLKPNEQNVKNRAREKKFNAHIQKMKLEQEAWSEVGSFYKPMLSEVEKREKEMLAGSGKGKQRATLEEIARWDVDERDIPERFCGPKGIKLALDIVGAVPDTSGPLEKRLQGLEFITDRLHSVSHSALESTRIVEADLDRRFALLHASLAARSQLIPPTAPSTSPALSSFLPSSISRPPPTTDPQDILHALSLVDAERPQAQVGDAARRAAREVQRANDASAGMLERRLTGVPPPTPRKLPGTPRRATTPGRNR